MDIKIIEKIIFKFINYLIAGGIGVLLNLIVTVTLTEFFLGRENYFFAFVAGTVVNITYNFYVYSFFIFKKKNIPLNRGIMFYAYSLFTVYMQLVLTDALVSIFGINYYFPIIVFVIGTLAVISFVVFNFYIFRK